MIGAAHVDRVGDELVVRWTGTDEAHIRIGRTPGHWGLSIPGRNGEARTKQYDPAARHFARIEAPDGSVMVTAERLLAMAGTVNFRDLGGYVGADGRRVSWGRVYRSDNLGALTASDLSIVAELGVRLVCDLRRDEEREEAPSRLPESPRPRVLHLGIGGAAAETRTIAAKMMRGEIASFDERAMAEVYALVLSLHAEHFGRLVREVADSRNHAMLVHCTAGKDRTGLACALLLCVLGVSDADVLADYALTSLYYSAPKLAEMAPRMKALGVDFDRVRPFFDASEQVMAETLSKLRHEYGSVEDFLLGPGGLTTQDILDVRAALLEPLA